MGKNAIDFGKIEKVVLSTGTKTKEQAGFLKVGNFSNDLFLYVARTKKVSRIDIAGFSAEGLPACRKLAGDERHGSVEYGVDFSLPESEVLAGLELLIIHMLSLPKGEKKPKVGPMANRKDAAKSLAGHVPSPADPKDNVTRLELIRKVAAEKGVPVSVVTELALSEDVPRCEEVDGFDEEAASLVADFEAVLSADQG